MYYFPEGCYYEGCWSDDKRLLLIIFFKIHPFLPLRSGHGKFVWPDGSFFEGQWENSHRNQGVFKDCEGYAYRQVLKIIFLFFV